MRNSLTTFNASVSRKDPDAGCFLVLLDPDRSLPPDFLSEIDVEIQEADRPPDAAASAPADTPPAAAVKVHAAQALGAGRWRQKG